MSGTSLDGVDIAFCTFDRTENDYTFRIVESETFAYNREWKNRLRDADRLSGRELFRLDHQYGDYLGEMIAQFIKKHALKPDFIASHGHTVFHEPSEAGSMQIGNGHNIYATSGIKVISDFRNLDIALGGQGAPLVPAGDEYLFSGYDYCLNLGGFSNISYREKGIRIAYDICPVNTLLNDAAMAMGYAYDNYGELGRRGEIHQELCNSLNSLEYYRDSPPKSTGREFLSEHVNPLIEKHDLNPVDLLASLYEHISEMISNSIKGNRNTKVLVTGGGAKNSFLIEKIVEKTSAVLIVPEEEIVDFKEALIFAFLGVLRYEGKNNCFASVTGAREDNCGGILYGGPVHY